MIDGTIAAADSVRCAGCQGVPDEQLGGIDGQPFRRLMGDPRFAGIPKILETPKGDDEVSNDRRMLELLRGLAE